MSFLISRHPTRIADDLFDLENEGNDLLLRLYNFGQFDSQNKMKFLLDGQNWFAKVKKHMLSAIDFYK